MKTRKLVAIIILFSAVLIVAGGCVITSKRNTQSLMPKRGIKMMSRAFVSILILVLNLFIISSGAISQKTLRKIRRIHPVIIWFI